MKPKRPDVKTLDSSLGVRAFAALMIVSALGVLFKFPISLPNQLFFNRDIAYTSTHYSYKPGQSGTSYDFFIQNSDGLYVALPLVLVLLLAFLFYFGIFSAIAAFIGYRKGTTTTKRDTLFSLLIAAIFISPQYLPVFDYLNIDTKGAYWTKERVVISPETMYEIGIQKIRGVHINADHVARSCDSSFAVLKKIQADSNRIIFADKLNISGSNLHTAVGKDTLWVFEKKSNYLKAYSMRQQKVVVENLDALGPSLPGTAQADIVSFDYSSSSKVLSIRTDDGNKYYFNPNTNTFSSRKTYAYPLFYFSNLNKHRKKLQLRTGTLTAPWNTKRVFLDASVVASNANLLIIRHRPNIKEKTKHLISAFDLETATLVWQLNEADYSFLQTIYGNPSVRASMDQTHIVLHFYDSFTLKGSVILSPQGKVRNIIEATPTIF